MNATPSDSIDFFVQNNIPILPLHGITEDGICTCRLGKKCPSPGKHPLMKKWQMLATTDKKKIMSWIGTGKKPVNLGIATGRYNQKNGKYLVSVDLDEVGHSFLNKLNSFGETVTQRSGGGGDHALYWSKYPIKNSVELVDQKVDIRGQGGLLVIAPSRHVSGKRYEFSCDITQAQIQVIPEFLEREIWLAKNKSTKVSEAPVQARKNKGGAQQSFWSRLSVTEIRERLSRGEIIPMGVRNATMHRLLSSDRAKGAGASELRAKSREYLRMFADSDDFSAEVDGIIGSVLKYPAYNNSHEKVNEVYVAWLRKNGHKHPVELETLNSLDKTFFDQLEPAIGIDDGLSLYQIAETRMEYLKSRGMKNFATYKLQLLAKKLQSLGITRKKTARGNLWMARLKKREENLVQMPVPVCETAANITLEKLSMATEVKDEEKKKGLKDGDIIDHQGKKVRVEIQTYKTKVKEHSHEHLYRGRTGYDYNKALMALMGRMTEEQMAQFDQDELVMNPEATNAWMNQVRIGDVVGVKCERYLVEQIAPDSMLCVRASNVRGTVGEFVPDPDAQSVVLTVPALDHARELGLLEILWRDGSVVGEDATKDMKVVFLHDLTEEEAAKLPAAGKNAAPEKAQYNQKNTTKKKGNTKTGKKK